MSKGRPVSSEVQDGVLSPDGKNIYLYRAEIDPRVYFPNHGDFIEKFQTPSEIDRMTILESIKEALGETLFNKIFLEQSFKDIANDTVLNPGWMADKALSAMCFLLDGQTPKGTGGAAMEINKHIRKAYQMTVVNPRIGLAFPLPQDITLQDVRLVNQGGTLVEQKLAANQIPYYLAQVWIVSDTRPAVVNKEGLTQGGKSFVCFSEKDAKNLIDAMEKNQTLYTELGQFNEVPLDLEYKKISRNVHHAILNDYVELLDSLHNQFEAFIQRQNEYRSDMDKIKNEFGLNQAGDRQTIWRAALSANDYPHFEQIELIFSQIKKCKELDTFRQNISSKGQSSFLDSTLSQTYRELQLLMTMLANHIKSHPYQTSDSLVPSAFEQCVQHMQNINAEIKQDIPEKIVQAENEVHVFDEIEKKYGSEMKDALEDFYTKKIIELRKCNTYKNARPEEQRQTETIFLKLLAKSDISKIHILSLKDANKFYQAMQAQEHWLNDMDRFMHRQINVSQGKQAMEASEVSQLSQFTMKEAKTLEYYEVVFQELETALIERKKYPPDYNLDEKFRALQNYINFQKNPNSKNYIVYRGSINEIRFDKKFMDENVDIKNFIESPVLGGMNIKSRAALEHEIKNMTSKSKEDERVLLIFKLDNFISEVGSETFNTVKYEEMIAAQAYKNFLLKPSPQNYNELKMHLKAVEGSHLAEIVKAVEAMKIKVTSQDSPEWNVIKNRCIEKLQTYLSVLEAETFNWNKDTKIPAAKSYINWLQNPTPATEKEKQKYVDALNDGRLKDAIADVEKYKSAKDKESEGTTPRKFH